MCGALLPEAVSGVIFSDVIFHCYVDNMPVWSSMLYLLVRYLLVFPDLPVLIKPSLLQLNGNLFLASAKWLHCLLYAS